MSVRNSVRMPGRNDEGGPRPADGPPPDLLPRRFAAVAVGQRRMGKASGQTMSWMLRATPGCREVSSKLQGEDHWMASLMRESAGLLRSAMVLLC